MDSTTLVARFRRFLLYVAGALALGTIVELLLAEHYEDPLQLVPFALCGLAVVVIGAALLRPSRATLWTLRGVMALLIGGSLLGVWEHLEANLAFELDIRPGAGVGAVLLEALKGAAPLLAPGILALAGVLAIAATYYHPALQRRSNALEPSGERSAAKHAG